MDVLIPTERHPACRQREPRLGVGTERENLAGDAKGNGASGYFAPVRARARARTYVGGEFRGIMQQAHQAELSLIRVQRASLTVKS